MRRAAEEDGYRGFVVGRERGLDMDEIGDVGFDISKDVA